MQSLIYALQFCTPCSEKKEVELIFVITSANIDRFSKFLHWQIRREILGAIMMETSNSLELYCYTTLSNLKIQHNFVSSFHHFLLKY